MATIQIKRGTLAQLDAAKTASGLNIGEPYLVTDSNALAIGTAINDYTITPDFSTLITTTSVTYETLSANGDVGTGTGQLAIGDHTHTGVYEPVLGNPAADGYVLSSTAGGTRSWVPTGSGGGIGEFISTANIAISEASDALSSRSTGNYNQAIGNGVLSSLTSGDYNIALGHYNLADLVGGDENIAIGRLSGRYNIGSYNISIGRTALAGNATSKLTGSYNTGIGYQTGYNLTTGQYNFLGGYQAGYDLTVGNNNVFLGRIAGADTTGGGQNVAVGYQALNRNSLGSNNVAIGQNAGYFCTGSDSVFLGNKAGQDETAGNKLHIANNSTESLIEGDFSNKTLTVNGTIDCPYDIEITDSTKGIILTSPDSTRWRVTVGNDGALTTTEIV